MHRRRSSCPPGPLNPCSHESPSIEGHCSRGSPSISGSCDDTPPLLNGCKPHVDTGYVPFPGHSYGYLHRNQDDAPDTKPAKREESCPAPFVRQNSTYMQSSKESSASNDYQLYKKLSRRRKSVPTCGPDKHEKCRKNSNCDTSTTKDMYEDCFAPFPPSAPERHKARCSPQRRFTCEYPLFDASCELSNWKGVNWVPPCKPENVALPNLHYKPARNTCPPRKAVCKAPTSRVRPRAPCASRSPSCRRPRAQCANGSPSCRRPRMSRANRSPSCQSSLQRSPKYRSPRGRALYLTKRQASPQYASKPSRYQPNMRSRSASPSVGRHPQNTSCRQSRFGYATNPYPVWKRTGYCEPAEPRPKNVQPCWNDNNNKRAHRSSSTGKNQPAVNSPKAIKRPRAKKKHKFDKNALSAPQAVHQSKPTRSPSPTNRDTKRHAHAPSKSYLKSLIKRVRKHTPPMKKKDVNSPTRKASVVSKSDTSSAEKKSSSPKCQSPAKLTPSSSKPKRSPRPKTEPATSSWKSKPSSKRRLSPARPRPVPGPNRQPKGTGGGTAVNLN